MKQLARKFRSLSLVPPSIERKDHQVSSQGQSLTDHFEGWLNSVDPAVLLATERPTSKAAATPKAQRPLTSTDLIRVNRATVRESNDHRHWPPGTVEKFMAAEVISRKGRKS